MERRNISPFLQTVADDLRRRFDNDLSRVAVVFPNKRAGIFFDDYVTPPDSSPLWAPTYLTIDQLFGSLSPLKAADDIETVCRLYPIYVRHTGETGKSLDWFYGWGEKLLSDFNDADNSMADARSLFANLRDIKEIEQLADHDMQQVLQHLRDTLGIDAPGESSGLKASFLSLWQHLYDIYRELNDTLAELGCGYEGARFRRAVEMLESGQTQLTATYDHYAFVGFNVLLRVEERLFRFVQKTGKALFYWDCDALFLDTDTPIDIGDDMKRNLRQFPSALEAPPSDHLRHLPQIDFVASASDHAQARFVSQWVAENLTTDDERRTAVVLCDETLLQPVIQSLPAPGDAEGPGIHEVNVTKGFPLSHTPAYASVMRFCEQATGQPEGNAQLLESLARQLEREALAQHRRHGDRSWVGQLHTESYFQCYTTVNRLSRLVADGLLDVQPRTLINLLRQVMRRQSIPFHGEPATGLQIMGMLETRCLDFERILLLSVNEGVMPQTANDNSFIPYDLRKAFGLTTSRQKTAVYAYNFFRLLARAGRVTLVYNEATDGLRKGEMSRFMLQLSLIRRDGRQFLPISCFSLQTLRQCPPRSELIVSQDRANAIMNSKQSISPSALSTYLRCPLAFFFQHAAYLNVIEPPTDLLPANTFGTIFHEAAQKAYQLLTQAGPSVTKAQISALSENELALDRLLSAAFLDTEAQLLADRLRHAPAEWAELWQATGQPDTAPEELERLRHQADERLRLAHAALRQNIQRPQYPPEQHVVEYGVLKDYLRMLLEADAQLEDLRIEGLEEKRHTAFGPLTIGGIIDRRDTITLDGRRTMRILDYKTGAFKDAKVAVPSLEELIQPEKEHRGYILQTFLYSLVCHDQAATMNPDRLPIAPALFFVQKSADRHYRPYIRVGRQEMLDFAPLAEDYRATLQMLLHTMATSPMTPTGSAQTCATCPYRLLCQR